MRTYTELAQEYEGNYLWDCDAGMVYDEDSDSMVRAADVLIYASQEDMDADVDNSLAIYRETVIDDRV